MQGVWKLSVFFERLGFEVAYTGKVKKTESLVEKKTFEEVKTVVVSESTKVENTTLKKEREVQSELNPETKIKIPIKGVIEQKNALQLLLNKMFGGDIVCEKTYPWMKTPKVPDGEYQKLIAALTAYRGDSSFAKKNVTLRCDFVCESAKLIIEYDERQHFSKAREISLKSYADIPLDYDRELWIKACESIGAKDNQPANRDEVRAYYDSVRDIEAYRNGYRLVRIMHGQVDFESQKAAEIIDKLLNGYNEKNPVLKVGMYLQTNELTNKRAFDRAMRYVVNSDIDLLVFPEFTYAPFLRKLKNIDIAEEDGCNMAFAECLEFSRELGKAVVINTVDRFGAIYSIFANALCSREETQCALYIKHTMTNKSILGFEEYSHWIDKMYKPVLLKGYRIGMSICYDCNHALFDRMYGLNGVDLIVNSTGGDVIYDKWYKYNKVRAIENSCYNLVTMGGDGMSDNPHCYVYGFNANGRELNPHNLCGNSEMTNNPGGIYVYKVLKEAGEASEETSLHQVEKENKQVHIHLPAGDMDLVISKSEKIKDNLYRYSTNGLNVFFCMVNGMDIIKAEKVLPLLYAPELKKYKNRRYIIVNKHQHIDEELFNTKLSILLKVRSMENFCAVIVESDNINKCYQCGKNRTAQVVKPNKGKYGIDLQRTGGAEAIWKNKQGMRAQWRKGFEMLIEKAVELSNK